MRIVQAVTALMLVAGSVWAGPQQGIRDLGFLGVAAREIMPPECVVRFHTGGVGGPEARDAAQWRRIETFMTMSPYVKSVSRFEWGKEGEKTYCLVPRYAEYACETAKELDNVLAGSTLAVEVDMLPMAEVCDKHGKRMKEPEPEEPVEAEPESGHGAKKSAH